MPSTTEESETEPERLAVLSQACLNIHTSLDPTDVLSAVAEAARSVTGARFAITLTMDDKQSTEDWASAGFSGDERRVLEAPEGRRFLNSLIRGAESEQAEFRWSLGIGSSLSAPMQAGDNRLGWIWLVREDGGCEFSRVDEENVAMLADQAAVAITNTRRHEGERQAKADLLEVIDTSPVGVVVFDAQAGLPISGNQEALRIARGLRMPGRSLQRLGDALTCRRADGREFTLDELPLAQVLNTGQTVRAEEIIVQTPDGRSLTTLVNATPIRSDEGTIETVVVTLQDLTALEELERLRAEFLSMVSHELRTPLTSIKGSTTTLLSDFAELDPAEARRFIEIIDTQADRMRGLISELLDVVRIEAGTLSVKPEPSDLTGLVDEARNAFLRGGGSQRIEIDLALDLPQVQADPRRIVQALGNLLANSAQHSGSSSAIRVTATSDASEVAVTVSDDRPPVPTPPPHDLFGRFSSLTHGAGEEEELSLNLGLAICKGIVEAHGGRIWAENGGSEPGCRFTFTLTVAEQSRERDAGASGGRAPVPASSDRTRVLVVDDDPQALSLMRRALTSFGFAVIATADPSEALFLVQARRPELVLLDLVFPEADGIDLMTQILELADLPVLFVSGYGRDEIIVRALELGADDYLVKPVTPTELAARMRTVLRRRSTPELPVDHPAYRSGDLRIEYNERRVTVAGRPVRLAPTEYELLVELSTQAGRVLTHEWLLQRVWGLSDSGEARFVRAAVKRLRRKLGDDARAPRFIVTEPRVGYRLAPADDPTEDLR